MGGLAEALSEWRALLGDEHVVVDPAALNAARVATFATAQTVPAILRPADVPQVRAVMQVASAQGVAVHPSSRGRNYGYGSRVPVRDGCVLVDLARLDRIVAVDEALGTVTIQPGVTFQQLHERLKVDQSQLMVAAIGGPPEASVLGNALERGDGAGRNGDVFGHVCALEVVLPSGELVRTGLARFPNAKAARAFRWGVGPSLDGLFSQSNLGIVTELTVFLARRPAFLREFFGCVEDDAALAPLVDTLRELALEGTLGGTFFIWNDFKALSKLSQYPFERAGERTPLPASLMEESRKQWAVGRWNATGAIGAPDPVIGEAIAARVTRQLTPRVSRLLFNDGSQGVLAGVPTPDNLAMAYWRKRAPMPADPDPDRDGCGFIWCTCAVPFLGGAALESAQVAEPVFRLFGFEPNVALIAVSPRCLYLVCLVVYDRAVAGEDERAMACHHALLRELCEAGYPPVRLGIQAMEAPVGSDLATLALLRKLKETLDPAGVLSPGRYGL